MIAVESLAAQCIEYRALAADSWARGFGRTARMWQRLARRSERALADCANALIRERWLETKNTPENFARAIESLARGAD